MRQSWLDALTDAVDRVPGPRWLVYGVVVLAWVFVGSLVGWIERRTEFPTIDSILPLGAVLPAILLWSMQGLDDLASRALSTLRPLLDLRDDEIEVVRADLRRTPPAWAWVALVVGVSAGIGSVVGGPSGWGIMPTSSAATWAVAVVMSTSASVVVFGFLAHAIHQLRLVDRLHRRHVVVDLFRLEPLYAFATLTARTGITLIAVSALGFLSLTLALGETLALSAADFLSAAFLMVVSFASFILPLLSLHDRIVAEKDRRMAEANGTLALALAELHRRIGVGEVDAAAKLNDTVAAASSAVQVVARVSTWPWRQETLRAFLGAVLLPIALWVTFELLRRVLPD